MLDPRLMIALGGGAPPAGEPSPLAGLTLPLMMFAIFYFIWFQPMRARQKRLETLVKNLKSGDKVIINPGIFGTIVDVQEDSFQVRVDDKTRLRVLKSAVAGLQGQPLEMEKN
jgi:preprotein translocase YajC subunit